MKAMRKAQTSELMNLMMLVAGVSVLFIITYFLMSTPRKTSERLLIELHNYDRLLSAVDEFYYSKVSGAEVTLPQLLADRVVLDTNPVSYGAGFPSMDVDMMTTQFFDSYFKNKWFLNIPSKAFTLGHKIPESAKRVQTFEFLLPIPSYKSEIIKGYLYVRSE